MKKRIRMRWTCSDGAHHEHRWRWTAWLCGRWQERIGWPILAGLILLLTAGCAHLAAGPHLPAFPDVTSGTVWGIWPCSGTTGVVAVDVDTDNDPAHVGFTALIWVDTADQSANRKDTIILWLVYDKAGHYMEAWMMFPTPQKFPGDVAALQNAYGEDPCRLPHPAPAGARAAVQCRA